MPQDEANTETDINSDTSDDDHDQYHLQSPAPGPSSFGDDGSESLEGETTMRSPEKELKETDQPKETDHTLGALGGQHQQAGDDSPVNEWDNGAEVTPEER